jgi:hypothetical protein
MSAQLNTIRTSLVYFVFYECEVCFRKLRVHESARDFPLNYQKTVRLNGKHILDIPPITFVKKVKGKRGSHII